MKLSGTITKEEIMISSDIETAVKANSAKDAIQCELIPLNGRWEFDPFEYTDLWRFKLTGCSLPTDTEIECEKAFRAAASKWHKEHVYIGQNIDMIDSGTHYLYGCRVKTIRGNAVAVLASSRVNLVTEKAHLIEVTAKSFIKNACGFCCIDQMDGMSQISFMYGNSHLGRLTEGAAIDNLSGYASIDIVSDNSCIRTVENFAKIMCACGSARIINLNDDASVYVLRDNAKVGWPLSREDQSAYCDVNIINL